MNTPKISVIIPVYKVEPYLRRCLDSVAGQTYQNLEVIVVDDGSPDNCGAICDEYAFRDSRFLVLHTENGGAYAARNRALDFAKGEYISFADGDDWLEPEMFTRLLELAEHSNADIVQCELLNDGPTAQLRTKQLGKVKVYSQRELTKAVFREEITHCLLGKLFRAGLWRDRRFPEEFYHADAMLMAQVGSFCGTYARMDDALYHYSTGNPSITRGRKTPLHAKSMEKLFEAYSEAAGTDGPEGDYFICREIPSAGRLLLPSKEIAVTMALRHIHAMHRIFKRHWDMARTAEAYCQSPKAKRILWHIYRYRPTAASIFVYWYARLFRK